MLVVSLPCSSLHQNQLQLYQSTVVVLLDKRQEEQKAKVMENIGNSHFSDNAHIEKEGRAEVENRKWNRRGIKRTKSKWEERTGMLEIYRIKIFEECDHSIKTQLIILQIREFEGMLSCIDVSLSIWDQPEGKFLFGLCLEITFICSSLPLSAPSQRSPALIGTDSLTPTIERRAMPSPVPAGLGQVVA